MLPAYAGTIGVVGVVVEGPSWCGGGAVLAGAFEIGNSMSSCQWYTDTKIEVMKFCSTQISS